ncbi:DKNYY domain-containing protein [Achromobacter aloeverae]
MARKRAAAQPASAEPRVVLPYDVYAATRFFLATGRTEDEVLARIGLTPAQWAALKQTYEWLGSGVRLYADYFDGADDAAIVARLLGPRWAAPEGQEITLGGLTYHVERAAWKQPHIGPYADTDWKAEFIAAHPDMTRCYYSHDGERVYFLGQPLADRDGKPMDIDPASFRWLGGRWLADARHVYGQGQLGGARPRYYWYIVDDADRDTFTPLNFRYARDARRAYYITGKSIRSTHPESFEVVPEVRLNFRDMSQDPLVDTSVFARDRDHVYFYGTRLRGADPATFRVLGKGYSRDAQRVWFHDAKRLIEGADAATFRVPVPGEPHPGIRACATDRLRSYVDGLPQPAEKVFDGWRPFFEFHADLSDWWWHREAARRG